MIHATQLRCEHAVDPIGVDVPQPRFSWVLEPKAPDDHGWSQSAYQIVVRAGEQELWNSEKWRAVDCFDAIYAGPTLKPLQKLSWQVRLWDQHDRPSPWSEPAIWTMGLLSDKNWRGRWITAKSSDVSPAALPLFRRSFNLTGTTRRAIVCLCGLGQHELRINGQKVGDDLLSPGWTNYRKTCLYLAYDVTSLLREGESVLGIMLGNGMYNVTGGRYRKFKGTFGPPKLICQLMIEDAQGNATIICSDKHWRVANGPITFSYIFGGEDYDARLESRGWDMPGFDDAAWQAAIETEGPGGALIAQPSPVIRSAGPVRPAHFARPAPDTHVYDLGQNIAGIPTLTAMGQAGTKITLRTGELLDPAGRVTQENTGSPVSFSYTLRGEGVERWQPRFSYTGFRYVQVDGQAPLELEVCPIHASVRQVGRFSCSLPLFNRIHDLILAAITSNLQSVLTDCPHREKLGWLEQLHLMAPSIMFNYDVASFYEKVSRDMRDAQHDNGCVPTIAPEYVVFKGQWADFSNSPEWGSAIILAPWQAFQQYGSKRILEENFDAMLRYAEYLRSREDDDGILNFGLGDWYDIGPGDPGFSKLTAKGLTATATYIEDLLTLQKIAITLGRSEDAERMASRARHAKEAFNQRFYDAAKQQYDQGSQTAQAMPLALGLADPNHRDRILDKLIRDIRRNNNHITAGDIGFRYVLTALAESGRSDVIYDLLARTDPPSYGAQLARGATTLTEAWDANPRKSQNHLMLGHAEAWFWQSLAGVRIDLSQPPADRITIKPSFLVEISWAAASYESVLGTVAVRWERQPQGRIRISATLPSAGTLILPVSDPSLVREGRRSAQHAAGVENVTVSDGLAHFRLSAGEYTLEFPA